ncbi:MAG: histidine phosphatase family protein [Oscillospiraceae bacterium]|nr:histidine phosphatase family protein [Oscillospiraceae bacterium]
MKLMIVRHGEPNYAIDSLTPVGWEEARLLADRMAKLDVKAFYVSPMGRAQDTASLTLQKMGRTAETLPWLHEFPARIVKPNESAQSIAWDWLPQDWTAEPRFYSADEWTKPEVFEKAGVEALLKNVTDGLDALLEKHGYRRDGKLYRAERSNKDTIVLFCHFGLECVLLGHLLGISPMLLWHGACAAPTSVTTLSTEERREGIAYFRMNTFGDTSHLYAAGHEPSFAARFCEVYADFDPDRDDIST